MWVCVYKYHEMRSCIPDTMPPLPCLNKPVLLQTKQARYVESIKYDSGFGFTCLSKKGANCELEKLTYLLK